MQLILTQDVEQLGKAGELVNVKPGYGRNYLVPRGLAVTATTRNLRRLEHDKAVIEGRVEKQRAASEKLSSKLGSMTLQFERRVGEDDKLFGSVTAKDIADQLGVAGVEIDHRKIGLRDPVRALGKYEVEIKLGSGAAATLKFWVVGKDAD